ncbi:hypothetical protein [Brumimicrobium mesophilum]|uniref:hypothetical protein n=1 Tax=Brumimicrobium mesophilum TaxID=392717 RepID=UPI000D141067|nr:hypothetical protein [Brumimicrobium mesophilum]
MEDKELKDKLLLSKLKAEDKLKDRILHQINAEQALIPKKRKSKRASKENYFSIFGIMYAVILSLGVYFYSQTEKNPLESNTFVFSVIFVAGSFSIYWFLMVYMNYKKVKQ